MTAGSYPDVPLCRLRCLPLRHSSRILFHAMKFIVCVHDLRKALYGFSCQERTTCSNISKERRLDVTAYMILCAIRWIQLFQGRLAYRACVCWMRMLDSAMERILEANTECLLACAKGTCPILPVREAMHFILFSM
jgi:hypothetical protein